MNRVKFPLSSEKLELLLAFESHQSLQDLARVMAKDPSVISRGLQQLAEAYPVLIKVKGRWQITPLGAKINAQTKVFLSEIEPYLQAASEPVKSSQSPFKGAALIVINGQNALLNPNLGNRSNNDAEKNIKKLLERWRLKGDPVFHVRHVSDNSTSAFASGSQGAEFIPELAPQNHEVAIDKRKSSAFTDTSLLRELNQQHIQTLVLTGFTANECIDATARQASEFGFSTYVVGDATASFDISGHDGNLYPAERIHQLVLANLHALCVNVVSTAGVL